MITASLRRNFRIRKDHQGSPGEPLTPDGNHTDFLIYEEVAQYRPRPGERPRLIVLIGKCIVFFVVIRRDCAPYVMAVLHYFAIEVTYKNNSCIRPNQHMQLQLRKAHHRIWFKVDLPYLRKICLVPIIYLTKEKETTHSRCNIFLAFVLNWWW